jgi:hypothetical protein
MGTKRLKIMARKLKIYQTSQGFFDLAIAVPSMKAALEAWGANSNLFHQGFAKESDDPKIIAATIARPGSLLDARLARTRRLSKMPICPRALQKGVPPRLKSPPGSGRNPPPGGLMTRPPERPP